MSSTDALEHRLRLVEEVLRRSPDFLERPLGIEFEPIDPGAHLDSWRALARAARQPASSPSHVAAVLYLHVPFCARLCSYCLLSSHRAPARETIAAYVRALREEMRLFAEATEGLAFSALHVGGGTPTLLPEHELDALLGDARRLFSFSEDSLSGVEAHPATATRGRLETLARHGIKRLSLGVETMTPEVLQNVNRGDQTSARVSSAVAIARELGIEVNVDLLAGLPGETEASFAASVRQVLALEPDSMSVNRYLAENSPLQFFGYLPDDEENRRASRMLLSADRIIREERPPRLPTQALDEAGYGTQYVWDEGEAYFQQDMIGPASTLALGSGALGHVHSGYYFTSAGGVAEYVEALSSGRPAPVLASRTGMPFERAFHAADAACRGELREASFERVFGRRLSSCFGPELSFLLDRGLLERSGEALRKRSNARFHAVHLLAFLWLDASSLEAQLGQLPQVKPRAPGLSSEDARRALQAATRSQLDVLPTASSARQYEELGLELPSSVLWCRIAVRAAQASQAAGKVRALRY